jgi:hypothetical protein
LNGLTGVQHENFLSNTTINGSLDLNGLTGVQQNKLKANVKKLENGYNKEKSNCYFDGILSKVLFVSKRNDCNIYTTPFGFIVEKDNFTAHGKDLKSAMEDLKFKVLSEKIKKEPILPDTIITIATYRIYTGSCQQGAGDFQKKHNLKDEYLAKDLLPILEKHNAYGLENFKKLITF